MEGQEPRVCQEEEVVLHPDNVDQHEEKRFKSLWQSFFLTHNMLFLVDQNEENRFKSPDNLFLTRNVLFLVDQNEEKRFKSLWQSFF